MLLGIHVPEYVGIGDRIQFGCLPENFFLNTGHKLIDVSKEKPEEYNVFWNDMGYMLKEGIYDDEEIEAIPGAVETGKTEIDPITFSVVLARAEGIMSEMTETILATARNPILYGAKDFTCTLLNANAKVLSNCGSLFLQ